MENALAWKSWSLTYGPSSQTIEAEILTLQRSVGNCEGVQEGVE